MAFKPVSMADSVGFVSTYDPAIDKARVCDRMIDAHPEWSASNMALDDQRQMAWLQFGIEFAQAVGRDPAESERMLVFKDGEAPTRFVLGAVGSEDFNRIVDETQETQTHRGKNTERCWRFFLHGLRDIENWPGGVEKRKIGELEYVDPAWLRRTFIRDLRDVAIQVGQVIIAYNRLTEDEIKN